MPKPAVLNGIHEVLNRPVFEVSPAVLQLLARKGIATAQPGFVDRLIHSEYRQQNVPLVTFEKSASKLEQVTLLPSL